MGLEIPIPQILQMYSRQRQTFFKAKLQNIYAFTMFNLQR